MTYNLFDQDQNNGEEIVPLAETPVEKNTNDEPNVREEADLFSFSAPTDHNTAETARMSGLAWSTGFVLFGAIILMMLIGWGADLLFGTQPWGMIGGLVIGAVIGFIQLFRVSSEIFRK